MLRKAKSIVWFFTIRFKNESRERGASTKNGAGIYIPSINQAVSPRHILNWRSGYINKTTIFFLPLKKTTPIFQGKSPSANFLSPLPFYQTLAYRCLLLAHFRSSGYSVYNSHLVCRQLFREFKGYIKTAARLQ